MRSDPRCESKTNENPGRLVQGLRNELKREQETKQKSQDQKDGRRMKDGREGGLMG